MTLALYDVVIWADDSTSMSALDHGERIDDLRAILSRVADAATLFDTDGAFLTTWTLLVMDTGNALETEKHGLEKCLDSPYTAVSYCISLAGILDHMP